MMRMGFLMNISRTPVTEFSISWTSPLILAMMSPFLSWEKYPMGRERILLYIFILISLTTPVRMGIITAAAPK